MRLRGKTALVTRTGGGFGEGIARLFAAKGAPEVVRRFLSTIPLGRMSQPSGVLLPVDGGRIA